MPPSRGPSPVALSPDQRATHERILCEVTALPSASGREERVIEYVERFVRERPGLVLTRDAHTNLTISFGTEFARPATRPLFITAHMDHPAFVIERILSPSVLECSFRGGVMKEYFESRPRVEVHGAGGRHVRGVVTGVSEAHDDRFTRYIIECDVAAPWAMPGDVCVWDVGPSRIDTTAAGGRVLSALACDDLSALAAALCVMDALLRLVRSGPDEAGDAAGTSLLLTRAEEIGFVGAIGACKAATMPMHARVIALENSRAFAESPMHGGVIVRVGDRVSVFSPTLVDAVSQRATEIAGAASTVTAQQKLCELPAWRWQRKLMAGGACEASVFCTYGYEAMCVCLPLDNYHNMTRLSEAQAGTLVGPHEIGPERIGVDDYHSMIDLLLACAVRLPERCGFAQRLDGLWTRLASVLETAGDGSVRSA